MESATTSDALLHRSGGLSQRARSSGRQVDNADTMRELLKDPIVVKIPRCISVPPRSLQPLLLLPRENLPLACLDLSLPQGHFEYSRFYESNIKILDLESRMGARPAVLVARQESNQTCYALERHDNGLYTLCRLGAWVDLESLSNHATVAYSKLIRPRPVQPENTTGPEPTITPQLHKENKKRRLAIEAIQSLVKRPARSKPVCLASQVVEIIQPPAPVEDDAQCQSSSNDANASFLGGAKPDVTAMSQPVVAPEAGEAITQPTANDIFDNIRKHYFEALYHSKGSLAYFAKAPLSRARAAFHLDCDSTLEMNDLVEFLKGHVLTTVQIDRKYRETIPDIVAKMKMHVADSDDEAGTKPTKRKPKKMKLGKDGLYPTEDEHVRKWWTLHEPQFRDDNDMTAAMPQETRLKISGLRSRETQLQMILILEILALESSRPAGNYNESQLPGLPRDSALYAPKGNPIKKRNKHNFPMLLDVHADRLSIWQSTALDEYKMLDDSQTTQRKEAQKSDSSTSDPLKDFCVDIIVPFFSPRLPEHCDSINRKLGGPVMPSPPKPKPKKPDATTKPKPKPNPGSVIKWPVPPKSSRTLERVLSKESEQNRRSMSRGPSGTIALLRSASVSTVPILKREASEPLSLAELPKGDSKDFVVSRSRPTSSSSLVPNKRKIEEDKARRDAQVKAELQDAISGLRRPNREVVGKAMAEADERKVTTSLSQMRKSKKPTQHARFQSIVKATPVGARFRDAFERETHSQPAIDLHYSESVETDFMPSSSVIPSSAARKRTRDDVMVDESPALPPPKRMSGLVAVTPVRPSTLRPNSQSRPGQDEGVVLASSPVFSRKVSQLNFLTTASNSFTHEDSGIGLPSSPGPGDLSETPMKKRHAGGICSLEGFLTVTPAKKRIIDHDVAPPSSSGLGKENTPARISSIFDKLGWQDDFDDLA